MNPYLRAIRKDRSLIALILIFIMLAIFATVLANQLSFIPSDEMDENPSSIIYEASI